MKLIYFAWLRERLNRESEDVQPPASVDTIASLMDWLSERDEGIELAFANRSLIRAAIDHEMVEHTASLKGARTVAFFPPMTGG